MRFPDLYSRLLLTLIAGCLVYIAGTLRTLVQQANTYAALSATHPAAMPVSWGRAYMAFCLVQPFCCGLALGMMRRS